MDASGACAITAGASEGEATRGCAAGGANPTLVTSDPTAALARDRVSWLELSALAVAMFGLILFSIEELGLPAEVLWGLCVALTVARPLLWRRQLDMVLIPRRAMPEPACQALRRSARLRSGSRVWGADGRPLGGYAQPWRTAGVSA